MERCSEINRDTYPASSDKASTTEAQQPLESSQWFPSRLSIEEGGIERITEEQRGESKQKFWNAATFWYETLSACDAISEINLTRLM